MAGKVFWEKSLVDSLYTLLVKNFVEIALSRTVSGINAFLNFTQEFKMTTKMAGQQFLGKVTSILCRYQAENFLEIVLYRTVIEINVFYAEIQDGRKKWQKTIFRKSRQ